MIALSFDRTGLLAGLRRRGWLTGTPHSQETTVVVAEQGGGRRCGREDARSGQTGTGTERGGGGPREGSLGNLNGAVWYLHVESCGS